MNLIDHTKPTLEIAMKEIEEKKQYDSVSLKLYKYHIVSCLKSIDAHKYQTLNDIPIENIKAYIRSASEQSSSKLMVIKTALMIFKRIHPELNIPDESFYIDFFKQPKQKTDSKDIGSGLTDVQIRTKINGMRRGKLKCAYKLLGATQLSVDEAAQLTPNDIKCINQEQFDVFIADGKGGKTRTSYSTTDENLVIELKELIKETKEKKHRKLFFAKKTLLNKAMALGIQCHELSRIYLREKDQACSHS